MSCDNKCPLLDNSSGYPLQKNNDLSKKLYIYAPYFFFKACILFLGASVGGYMDENVSTKVVNIIQSHTGAVDNMV